MNHSPESRPGIHNGVSDRILYSRPSRLKVASKRDHISIDKSRQGCHGDLRTSDYETVDALAPISVFHFLLVNAQGYVGLQRRTVRCSRIRNCKGSGCRITITSVYLTSPYRVRCQLFTIHNRSNYDKKRKRYKYRLKSTADLQGNLTFQHNFKRCA